MSATVKTKKDATHVKIDGTVFPIFDGGFKVGELAEIERFFRIPGTELEQYGAIMTISIAWVSAKRGGMPGITFHDLESADIEYLELGDPSPEPETPTVADVEDVPSESAVASTGLLPSPASMDSIPG